MRSQEIAESLVLRRHDGPYKRTYQHDSILLILVMSSAGIGTRHIWFRLAGCHIASTSGTSLPMLTRHTPAGLTISVLRDAQGFQCLNGGKSARRRISPDFISQMKLIEVSPQNPKQLRGEAQKHFCVLIRLSRVQYRGRTSLIVRSGAFTTGSFKMCC